MNDVHPFFSSFIYVDVRRYFSFFRDSELENGQRCGTRRVPLRFEVLLRRLTVQDLTRVMAFRF